ncbi:organic hydroperoxide resistance protein [Rhodocytophaga rosea]|uniref:Organic hydroperoxide resistance protein n=1 Tax=Rhodocytophaga rosea TaxID=2704465 RepID=A0A6C0GJ05_9BACT|nr:organic hydroperoxide resistance protein [Rhodocytophaga rosea]QHT67652.1 organic hydroperoxide resistance protein [Rhodocytophaga rosea]
MEILYSTYATATGGRNGHVTSQTGILDIEVRTPESLGGPKGDFLNPEILFAGGYAACFDSALHLMIRTKKIKTGVTTTTAHVKLGKAANGGFGLAVTLAVNIPGVDQEIAQQLVEAAHEVCPYSNATRGNIQVELSVTTDEKVSA